MQDQYENGLTECFDCGARIDPALDRAFAMSTDAFLCFECARRRGGVYDSDADRWIVPPDVSDEADERRPHP
jgi:hypothetical protein